MNVRDALILMADRVPWQSDTERVEVIEALAGGLPTDDDHAASDGEQSPAETQSDAAPAKTARRNVRR